jgi:hypothetical protein
VRARDHGEPERVRHALAVGLAVGRQAEHRLDQRLELERRADLAEEAGVGLAGVPEAVRRARLDGHELARTGDDLVGPGPEADLAVEHLEALGLVRMNVRRRDGAVGADDRLDEHGLAVGLLRGLVEDENLAGDGVLETVSLANHVAVLSSVRNGSLMHGQPEFAPPSCRRLGG